MSEHRTTEGGIADAPDLGPITLEKVWDISGAAVLSILIGVPTMVLDIWLIVVLWRSL